MPWGLLVTSPLGGKGWKRLNAILPRGFLGIDEADERDWGSADLSGEFGQIVKGLFLRLVENLILLSCGETRGFVLWQRQHAALLAPSLLGGVLPCVHLSLVGSRSRSMVRT